MKPRTIITFLVLAAFALPSLSPAADITPAEVRAIAKEAYIYGYPMVDSYRIEYGYFVDKTDPKYKGPANEIHNTPRVYTPADKAIQTPNSDTPYSILWLDLRAEPIVLSVPAVEKDRYFSVMLCDGNIFNHGYIGSRATGNEPGDYLVVGPDWKGETPAGIKKVFRSSTQFSAAAYRTQLFSPDDMPNVVKIQSSYKVQPLSAYLKEPAPPAAPAIDFPKIDKAMVKTNFFEYLDFALQYAPAGPEEKEIRAKLASIGIGAGKTFDFKDLSLEHKAAVGLGMKAGDEFPPVNSFWSVTMYDGKSQLLIKNPINRYLINSPMMPDMKKNEDGSLTLYIQKDNPGPDKEANWLPAPDGPPYLILRMYWPKTEGPFHLARRRRQLEAPGHREGEIINYVHSEPNPSPSTHEIPKHRPHFRADRLHHNCNR